MRALFLVATLLCSGPVLAQTDAEGEGATGKGEVRALAGTVLKLEPTVLGIEAKVVDLGGKKLDLVVKETKTEIRLELAADVLFEFDKADLRPQAKDQLREAAAFIREHAKKGKVTIEGHTDGKGNDGYNQKLSERRAQSVRDYFVKAEGLAGIGFSTKGFGKTKPVAPNTRGDGSDDPEGRQKNRRVEIVVSKT